jgi:hypothetical protein
LEKVLKYQTIKKSPKLNFPHLSILFILFSGKNQKTIPFKKISNGKWKIYYSCVFE